MKRCCHGTAHQKCHGKHEALLAVGVVYGADTKQLNTWVSFQSAEQPLLGQFSVSGNTIHPTFKMWGSWIASR
jgi:DNA helicase-2/ATP-dependent DNA helicase PcrA